LLAKFPVGAASINDPRQKRNKNNDCQKDQRACHRPLRQLNRLYREQGQENRGYQSEKGDPPNHQIANAQDVRLAAFILEHQ
jgi:hypothetical protein